MPKVGNKHFPYTKKGKQEAKAYAKKTGKPMTYAENQMMLRERLMKKKGMY